MTTEGKAVRQPLVKKLNSLPHADVMSVENEVRPGTPDINGCIDGSEFWIECKLLPSWPKRTSTPVRIKTFTKEQRLWLKSRWSAGGSCWLMLKVADTRQWFLFPGSKEVIDQIGNVPRGTLATLADCIWVNQLPADELRRAILRCYK